MKPVNIVVRDLTTPGTLTPTEYHNAIAAVQEQLRTHFNDSPWVEHGYVAPFGYFTAIAADAPIPVGSWVAEFIDDDPNVPGALAYHEDEVFNSEQREGKPSKGSSKSMRGLAKHPETGELVPVLKILVKTIKEYGSSVSGAFSHEALEALVDPFVTNEASIRRYFDASTSTWWLGEVSDPVQGEQREYEVLGVKVSDAVYPGFFDQPQTRHPLSIAEEYGTASRVEPFTIAEGGYANQAPQSEPTNWTQVTAQTAATAEEPQAPAESTVEPDPAPEPDPEPEIEAEQPAAPAEPAASSTTQTVTVTIDASTFEGWTIVGAAPGRVSLVAQPATGTASLEPVPEQPNQVCVKVVNAHDVQAVAVEIAIG